MAVAESRDVMTVIQVSEETDSVSERGGEREVGQECRGGCWQRVRH
jgi:hypothetical protein